MKLSREGLHTVLCLDSVTLLAKHEFEQSDFEGAVVLTLDEVLNLLEALELFSTLIDHHGYEDTHMAQSTKDLFLMLRERAKQSTREP